MSNFNSTTRKKTNISFKANALSPEFQARLDKLRETQVPEWYIKDLLEKTGITIEEYCQRLEESYAGPRFGKLKKGNVKMAIQIEETTAKYEADSPAIAKSEYKAALYCYPNTDEYMKDRLRCCYKSDIAHNIVRQQTEKRIAQLSQ